MENLLAGLNNKQKEAVSRYDGPSVILAGAGSGKTRALVAKVIHLIRERNISPKSILMITFTNKAASEMKARIGDYSLGFIGTFHSFCVRILRIETEAAGLKDNFVIYDDDDQAALVKSIIKDYGKKYTASYFINRISSAKNQLITPVRYLEMFGSYSANVDVGKVYAKYQAELKENNAVDFDDLIMLTVQLFKKNKHILNKYQEKYRYILVDEFQDTNAAQYELTRLLGEKYKNVTVVGDFSQSIYSWRGAEITNLDKFKNDFPGTASYLLEQNYRSSQKILDFAYSVISKNTTHPVLHLFTNNRGGEEIIFYEAESEEEEALYISMNIENLHKKYPYDQMAVLYRTNAQSRSLEEAFLHRGIPYMLVGGTRFYERREIKDILGMLRLLVNPVDKVSGERIQKLGKRRWAQFKEFYDQNKEEIEGKQTADLIAQALESTGYMNLFDPDNEEDYSRIENIKELKSVAVLYPDLTSFLEQVALVESEYFAGEKRSREGVRLMTLHQAKGLEFKAVFIAGVEEGILPHGRSVDDPYALEEERRLFYVGVTRAKDNLYISWARRRFIYGRRGEATKSRFLDE
ncbi:MAG: ATP-dependent helicase [Patescibacteria group bacterium]